MLNEILLPHKLYRFRISSVIYLYNLFSVFLVSLHNDLYSTHMILSIRNAKKKKSLDFTEFLVISIELIQQTTRINKWLKSFCKSRIIIYMFFLIFLIFTLKHKVERNLQKLSLFSAQTSIPSQWIFHSIRFTANC